MLEEDPNYSPNKRQKITKKINSLSVKEQQIIKDKTNASNLIISKEFFKNKVLIYDLETSCINSKCGGRIVEFAGMLVENGIPKRTMHMYFNPNIKCWNGAYKAHGLGDTFLRIQAPFEQVSDRVKEFMLGCDIRCAHNGSIFDDCFMEFELARGYIFGKIKYLFENDFLNIVTSNIIPKPNNDELINSLTSAAMMYYFKDYLSKELFDDKPGSMMFLDGDILPDFETNPDNYNAAIMRLTYFRLLKMPTETVNQRKRLCLPFEKVVRTAIKECICYLEIILKLFKDGLLNETEFRKPFLEKDTIFDTLTFVRASPQTFLRGVTIDNFKLDNLLDYYKISRYDREIGNHGAGIDTNLLFCLTRKMFGKEYEEDSFMKRMAIKSQNMQTSYFFKKNSICEFDDEGMIISKRLLHDDGIISTEFGDPNKKNIVTLTENTNKQQGNIKGAIINDIRGGNVIISMGDWTLKAYGEWMKTKN